MREWVERAMLAMTAMLVVLAGVDFARLHGAAPPPVVVELPAPIAAPPVQVWERGAAQPHALSLRDGWLAWAENDTTVHLKSAHGAAAVSFRTHGLMVGPVLRPRGGEACWFDANMTLQCASAASKTPSSLAKAPGSVVTMDADDRAVDFVQFDGGVFEARGADVRRLHTLPNASELAIDADVVWVVLLEPLRIAQIRRSDGVVTATFRVPDLTVGSGSLGALLQDDQALYLDAEDAPDGLQRVVRVTKVGGVVTKLYEGYAHVAVTAIQGDTIFGVSAPYSAAGELSLEQAVAVDLRTTGGPLGRVKPPNGEDVTLGWGGSLVADADWIYYARGPRNPVGLPGDVWRLPRGAPPPISAP